MTSRSAVIAAILVFVSLLMRMAILPWAITRIPLGDPVSYAEIADNIINGHRIIYSRPPFYVGGFAIFPPLYPILLAVVGLVAPLTAPTFLIVNWVIDIITAALIFWISRQIDLIKSGIAAASTYLLWPTNLLMAPVAQKEGLAALLSCAVVGVLLAASERPSRSVALAYGALSALLALTQPALVTLPALLALVMLPRFRSRKAWLETVGLGICSAIIVMLPWWIRNYLIFDQFVPLTTSSGPALWIGTMSHGFENTWIPLADYLTHQGSEVEISKRATYDAVTWISAHPLSYFHHTLIKAAYMLYPDRWNVKPLAWMLPAYLPPVVFKVIPMLASAALFAAAGIGGVLARGSVIRPLVVACLLQLFLVQIWFEFPERHRYFMIPLLAILAAEGMRLLIHDFANTFGRKANMRG